MCEVPHDARGARLVRSAAAERAWLARPAGCLSRLDPAAAAAGRSNAARGVHRRAVPGRGLWRMAGGLSAGAARHQPPPHAQRGGQGLRSARAGQNRSNAADRVLAGSRRETSTRWPGRPERFPPLSAGPTSGRSPRPRRSICGSCWPRSCSAREPVRWACSPPAEGEKRAKATSVSIVRMARSVKRKFPQNTVILGVLRIRRRRGRDRNTPGPIWLFGLAPRGGAGGSPVHRPRDRLWRDAQGSTGRRGAV